MSIRAWIYLSAVFIIALVITAIAGFSFDPATAPWLTFAILAVLATVAQLFKSEAPTHQLYHPALLFFFAGVLLLPPVLFVLVVIVAHLFEWVKERLMHSVHLRSWYIQPFNIAMHVVVGVGARGVFLALNPQAAEMITPLAIGVALFAAFFYSLSNHLLVGLALVFARNVSWQESEILKLENISIDFAMLVMGILVADFLEHSPLMIVPILAPLYLIYKALSVPILKRQASTDPKTGLWNPNYFLQMLEAEISRSVRFERPLTVIVGDLDLLRNINNVYGHLAGDAVLIGVARILRENLRSYDVVSRFGGEEFAILMPELHPKDAVHRIEGIRNLIQARAFEDPVTHRWIKATMSFGVGGGVPINQTAKEVIHRADVAVYQAKMQGRNCTCLASEELHYFEEGAVVSSNQAAPDVGAVKDGEQ